MSHPEQMNYIQNLKNKYSNYFNNSKVIEVGSLNINGTVRVFFNNCEYIGSDVDNGNCVDVVCEGQNLKYEDNFFDTSISCECFEHNPYWIETFKNMYRMTKNNGIVIMTCATTGRAEHGTSRSRPEDAPLLKWDYYKNLTEEDFRKEFDFDLMFSQYAFEINNNSKDLYFYGIKK